MAKVNIQKGIFRCPITYCSYLGTSERALSNHFRFGHCIAINKYRDKLMEFRYSRKNLNRMDEIQLKKEVEKLKEKDNDFS